MLQAEDVSLSFGGVHAIEGVDLTIHDGEILGLIGPNGAGKTSLLNCMSGVYRPDIGPHLASTITSSPGSRRTRSRRPASAARSRAWPCSPA